MAPVPTAPPSLLNTAGASGILEVGLREDVGPTDDVGPVDDVALRVDALSVPVRPPKTVGGAIVDFPKAEASGMGLPPKAVGGDGVDDAGTPPKVVGAEEPNVELPNAEVLDPPNAEDPNPACDPNALLVPNPLVPPAAPNPLPVTAPNPLVVEDPNLGEEEMEGVAELDVLVEGTPKAGVPFGCSI